MSEKPVVIFGVGAFAQVAEVYLRKDSPREVIAFTVDGEYVTAQDLRGPAGGGFEELPGSHPPERVDLLVATGFRGVNKVRRGDLRALQGAGLRIRDVCQLEGDGDERRADRREHVRLRGQCDSAVRRDRQRCGDLERQPHRPSQPHRRSLLHRLARGDLGPCADRRGCRSSESMRRFRDGSRSGRGA